MAQAEHKTSASEITRQQLIQAAERLFAENGIDGVSLRQINLAAGQKNSSAAHYHFGSKQSLIMAIYSLRMQHVNERRLPLLDEIEASGHAGNIRLIIESIVRPIVDEIEADDSGQYYIRFMAQAIGHPQLDLSELWHQEHGVGLARAIGMLRRALPEIPEAIFGQRFGLAFEQIIHSLADREKLRNSSEAELEINAHLFVCNLIDTITGAISAPLSRSTRQELDRLASDPDAR